MKRAASFIAIGVAAYLLILVFTVPAVSLESHIEKRVRGLSLSVVSGSVFHGQAGRVSYRGTELGSARWQFLLLPLLAGRVEYHVEFSAAAGPGQANAGVTFFGNAFGRDIDVSFLPDLVIDRYSPVDITTSGVVNMLLESITLSGGFPRELSGKLVWKSAAILSPVEIVLGDTVLALQGAGEELVGSVENEGEFGISGEIAMNVAGEYRLDLLLVPDATADRDAVLLLENAATVQPGGKYLLRSSGRW